MLVDRPSIDRFAALLGLAAVVCANVRYLWGFADVFDPPVSMEPYFIEMARLPIVSILGKDPAWGPLYGLWLKPLRMLFDDPLVVYAANIQVLSAAVSLLIYAYVLMLTRGAALATAAALSFVVSDLNVPLESKVCAFALMVVLFGLVLSELVRGRAARTGVAAAGFLIASYARPELFAAGLFTWGCAVWYEHRDGCPAKQGWLVAGSAAILLAAVSIGTPLWSLHHDNNRLLEAFREHFARNWGRWNGGWQYYLSVWEREFGSAEGVLQAFWVNPISVGRHMLDNAEGVVKFFAISVFEHHPVLVPEAWPLAVTIEGFAFSAVFLALVAFGVSDSVRRRIFRERYGHLSLPFAAIAVFSLASATVVFPKPHYLLIPGVLWLLLPWLVASITVPWPPLPRSRWVAALAAVACVAATPTPFAVPRASRTGDTQGPEFSVFRPTTDTIRQIRSLGLRPPVHVLTLTDGIGELLGEGFEEVKIWEKGDQSLETYTHDRHVDVIVTMERGRDSFVVADPYWTLIETDPAKAGYTRMPTRDPRRVRIYLRTDLARPTRAGRELEG